MKHAYLILAHTDFAQLRKLLSEIDDVRNDIYIHFDSKVQTLPEIEVFSSKLHILSDREDVRWGDWTVVEAEYKLFEAAAANGPYAYYHLMSGADRCLRTQDEIHAFFDAHRGQEFIGFTFLTITPRLERHVMRWHLFPRSFREQDFFKRALRAAFLRFQEFFGIRRNKGIDFTKGSQWVSVTEDMVRVFLQSKEWSRRIFTHTFCPDEVVMQTLCWNSPLKKNIYNTEDDGVGCVRAISWKDGVMLNWEETDIPKLKEGPALFARKFMSSK